MDVLPTKAKTCSRIERVTKGIVGNDRLRRFPAGGVRFRGRQQLAHKETIEPCAILVETIPLNRGILESRSSEECEL